MRSPLDGMRAGRIAVSIVSASLALAACRADAVSGHTSSCTDEPGCESTAEAVSPHVINALQDVGSRLTGAMNDATASALIGRLEQLEHALVRRDLQAGRLALAAAYDVIGRAERTSTEARADLGAIRLALIPAARALGVSSNAAAAASQ